MNPFYVLGLPHDASDEQVTQRYHELLRRYPPDVAPAQFQTLRAAYEAVRDEEARLHTRLFYFDARAEGVHAPESLPWCEEGATRRASPDELASSLRALAREGFASSVEGR